MSTVLTEQLDPRYWADLADNRGWRIVWHRTQRCPCLGVEGHPNPDCAVCSGDGFIRDPGVTTKFTIGSMSRRREWLQPGTIEQGEIMAVIAPLLWDRSSVPWTLSTPHPAYGASDGDLFVALDAEQTQSVVLTRDRRDKVRSHYPTRIVKVTALRGSGTEAQTVELLEGKDFRRDGRNIVWASAAEPASGEHYSVLYSYKPEFILRKELPSPHLNHDRPLPKRFSAMLLDSVSG